eukprot:6176973-Pleurochrysis_carterae.AAC.5
MASALMPEAAQHAIPPPLVAERVARMTFDRCRTEDNLRLEMDGLVEIYEVGQARAVLRRRQHSRQRSAALELNLTSTVRCRAGLRVAGPPAHFDAAAIAAAALIDVGGVECIGLGRLHPVDDVMREADNAKDDLAREALVQTEHLRRTGADRRKRSEMKPKENRQH